jgi:hypothetical protein
MEKLTLQTVLVPTGQQESVDKGGQLAVTVAGPEQIG